MSKFKKMAIIILALFMFLAMTIPSVFAETNATPEYKYSDWVNPNPDFIMENDYENQIISSSEVKTIGTTISVSEAQNLANDDYEACMGTRPVRFTADNTIAFRLSDSAIGSGFEMDNAKIYDEATHSYEYIDVYVRVASISKVAYDPEFPHWCEHPVLVITKEAFPRVEVYGVNNIAFQYGIYEHGKSTKAQIKTNFSYGDIDNAQMVTLSDLFKNDQSSVRYVIRSNTNTVSTKTKKAGTRIWAHHPGEPISQNGTENNWFFSQGFGKTEIVEADNEPNDAFCVAITTPNSEFKIAYTTDGNGEGYASTFTRPPHRMCFVEPNMPFKSVRINEEGASARSYKGKTLNSFNDKIKFEIMNVIPEDLMTIGGQYVNGYKFSDQVNDIFKIDGVKVWKGGVGSGTDVTNYFGVKGLDTNNVTASANGVPNFYTGSLTYTMEINCHIDKEKIPNLATLEKYCSEHGISYDKNTGTITIPNKGHMTIGDKLKTYNYDTAKVTVEAKLPKLSITKQADKKHYQIGDTVHYTVDVKNNSDGWANEVNITDKDVADGLSIVKDSVKAEYTNGSSRGDTKGWKLTETDKGFVCNSAYLKDTGEGVGEIKIGFDAKIDKSLQGKSKTNTAYTECYLNDQISDSATINVGSPSLTIDKTSDKSEYSIGDTVKYTVKVQNSGDRGADLSIKDEDVTGGLTIDKNSVDFTSSGVSGGKVTPTDTGFNFTADTIDNNGVATITFNATIEKELTGKTKTNTAYVSAYLVKPIKDDTTITVGSPKLEINKEGGYIDSHGSFNPEQNFNVDEKIHYVITTENTSDRGADLEIKDTDVIDGLIIDKDSIKVDSESGVTKGNLSKQDNGFIYTADTIDNGGKVVVSFDANPEKSLIGKDKINNAYAKCYETENVNDSWKIHIKAPYYSVKKMTKDYEYQVNEEIPYKIDILCADGTAADVVVTDKIPNGLTVSEDSIKVNDETAKGCNIKFEDNTITYTADYLQKGHLYITFNIIPDKSLNGQVVENDVLIKDSYNVSDDNVGKSTVYINSPKLDVEKAAIGKDFTPNKDIPYKVTLKNINDGTFMRNIVFKDSTDINSMVINQDSIKLSDIEGNVLTPNQDYKVKISNDNTFEIEMLGKYANLGNSIEHVVNDFIGKSGHYEGIGYDKGNYNNLNLQKGLILEYTAKVTDGTLAGSEIERTIITPTTTNTKDVLINEDTDIPSGGDEASAVITLEEPHPTLSKTVDSEHKYVGETGTYTLIYKNELEHTTIKNVQGIDKLDLPLGKYDLENAKVYLNDEDITKDSTFILSDEGDSWKLETGKNLPYGQELKVVYDVKFSDDLKGNTELTNIATFWGDNASDVKAEALVTFDPSSLTYEKQVQEKTTQKGQDLHYTLLGKSIGTNHNVIITDTISSKNAVYNNDIKVELTRVTEAKPEPQENEQGDLPSGDITKLCDIQIGEGKATINTNQTMYDGDSIKITYSTKPTNDARVDNLSTISSNEQEPVEAKASVTPTPEQPAVETGDNSSIVWWALAGFISIALITLVVLKMKKKKNKIDVDISKLN